MGYFSLFIEGNQESPPLQEVARLLSGGMKWHFPLAD